jgi:hypothetical protein
MRVDFVQRYVKHGERTNFAEYPQEEYEMTKILSPWTLKVVPSSEGINRSHFAENPRVDFQRGGWEMPSNLDFSYIEKNPNLTAIPAREEQGGHI